MNKTFVMESNAQVDPTSSKNQQILNLISNYKKHISQTQLKDEVYKWELLNKFKGRPDVNAQNFENEYKSVKFANLMYHLSFAVGKHICREKPEEFRQLFVHLYDEKTDLSTRVKNFNEESLTLYRSLGEEKGHHQDDRAISVYLTFHNPEKYTFYKSAFYSDFCELLEIPTAGKNERYTHYLELLSDFIEKYIIPDTELIETVKSLIPEYYDGTNHLLLAQDILYCMLNKFKEEVNYWIFQGNPKIYDFVEARNKGAIDQWTATAHRDKMKIGDKVIFWLTGADAGCYALGEITSEPFENNEEQDEFWKKEDKTEWKVGVKVTHDLSTSPILREIVDSTEEFRELKVGHQGTNFAASKQEYECFLDIFNSRKTDAYSKIKKALDADKLGVFIRMLKKFTTDHGLKENDHRISFNIRENKSRLVFVIGSRYSLCIEKNKNETILSFISEYNLTNTTEVPFKNKKGDAEAYWINFNFDKPNEFEKYVFDGLNSELQRNYHCNYKNFSNHEFAADILGKSQIKYWLYAPGENANMWDEFYEKGIMGLGWDEIGDLTQYKSRDEIKTALIKAYGGEGSKKNDISGNDDFLNKMAIGDVIFTKKGRNTYLGYGYVTSDYYYDQSAESYKHRRKVRWEKYGNWDTNHSIVLKTLTDITNVRSKSNPSLMAPEAILNIINGIQSDKKNQMPINQILYGPPGTGKTYELKSHYFPKYTSQESSISAEQHFKNVVSECSWWQVIALALLDLDKPSKVVDIMNNRWVQMKFQLSDAKNIRPVMWSALQSHTIQESDTVGVKLRQPPYVFNKKDDSSWEVLENEVRDQIPELYDTLASVEKFSPRADKKFDRYFFTTFHQSYSYEDFIEGIKPVLENEESDGSVAYRIEDGIFKQICKKAEIDPENQYAIFIDEINRGNISAIFGELITLIEQDKRKGAANEMTVILPYSKKPFSVPQNLDIIGTMNTADRSVEALDTALRRRFSFVEMLPKPELLKDKGENNSGEIEGIDLFSLLSIINERIEVLVDRDHTIGHAFFINDTSIEDLRNTFANKIIPLLQEYFYGDYSKMELVIGSAFFEKKEVSKVKFAVKSDDFEAEGQVYHIKNISEPSVMSDEDFISALTTLINGEA